jgi:hypothetical protein
MHMADSGDLFGDDPAMEEFAEEFERHRNAIYGRLSDYMDAAEIDEAYMAQLLIDAMIRMRMTAYGLGVESPSVAGLKLDLDRLRNEVNEFVREAKKGAEEYIGHVKEARAEADAKLAAEGEEENENPE